MIFKKQRRPGCYAAPLRWAGVLAVALTLAGCASPGTCRMVRATDLPLAMESRHLVAAVEINGLPARMMIDTGANVTVLTREAIARMKLPEPVWTRATVTGIGGSRDLSVLETARFKLGAMTGRNLDFGVMEGSGVLGPVIVDGIIGMDLLSQVDLDLDLPASKLILYRALDGCAHPSAVLHPPLTMLPMAQPHDETRVMIRVTIANRPLIALLDTGATTNIIFRRTARALGLDDAALAHDRRGTIAGIGPREVRIQRHIIEPVTVGDLTILNMPVAIADDRATNGEDLILGLDFFARVHAWMSFSSRTLIMQFPPQPSPAAQ